MPQIGSFASAGYQPVALDLPGYGMREPVDAMSFEAIAADVEFTLVQSGFDKPVLPSQRLACPDPWKNSLRGANRNHMAAPLYGCDPPQQQRS